MKKGFNESQYPAICLALEKLLGNSNCDISIELVFGIIIIEIQERYISTGEMH